MIEYQFRLFELIMNNAEKCAKYRKRKIFKEKDRELTLNVYQHKYKELKKKYRRLKHDYKLFKLYHDKCQYDRSNTEINSLLEREENESNERRKMLENTDESKK